MLDTHSPRQNRLLAALPADVSEPLFPHLEQIPMSPGDVLFEPGRPLRHVHFPTTAIVSLHYTQAVIAQMSQTAFCNRHHTLDQQFCRRLLLCLDRLHANEIAVKQDWHAHLHAPDFIDARKRQ